MWSAPFNFNHHSNWLGIGLSAPGVTEHAPGDAWFNLMYYKESSDNLKFERREYYADVRPVIYGYVFISNVVYGGTVEPPFLRPP